VSLNGTLQNAEFFGITYDPVNHLILGGTQDNGSPIQTVADGSAKSQVWHPLPKGGGDGAFVAVGSLGQTAIHYYFSNQTPYRDDTALKLSGLTATDQKALTARGISANIAVNTADPMRLLFGSGNPLLYGTPLQDLYESPDGGDTLTDLTRT